MKNKFLTIFLGIIISLFFANHCFALNAPTNATITDVGTASAILSWFWEEGGGEIEHFQIDWRKLTVDKWETEKPDPEETRIGVSTEYSHSLRGLEEDSEYEWIIKAIAKTSSQSSTYTDGSPFTTKAIPLEIEDPEENEEENGGENGEGLTIKNLFEGIENVKEAADAFMEFLVITGFAVGPILIIYAAFILLTKQGDPTAVTQAKKIILWTVISLSIMLFAKGIPSVVKDLFKS